MRFIDKDVVNAAVEPEEHPLRDAGIRQERPRLQDLVIEVENAALGFGLGIARQEHFGETQ